MNIAPVEVDVDVVKHGTLKLFEKFGSRTIQSVSMDAEEDETFFIMKLELSASA